MGVSSIEWCDFTFNPWWGCEKVSPGCAHCYADTLARRRAPGLELWGPGHAFRFFGEGHWAEPLKWARLAPAKLGRRPRVFCASMADVFEERGDLSEPRRRLFRLIQRTPELDWLVLTKRPEKASAWWAANNELTVPTPPNVWLGVSIENARHTYRADVLRAIPAAVRFISAEPLLGSLYRLPRMRDHAKDCPAWSGSVCRCQMPRPLELEGIDWVIVGGESGPGARPMHPAWARELRDACTSSGVAFFFKQWGEWSTSEQCGRRNVRLSKHRVQYESRRFAPDGTAYKANEPDLYSYPGMESLLRVGKRGAGRELDGRTWDEWPR